MNTKKIENGYKDIFQLTPAAILILDIDAPLYTILDANEAYLNSTNSTREELIGNPVFGAFPANPTDEVSKNIERTTFSFQQAIVTKKTHTMKNYRYDIPIRGTNDFEERYWTTSNTPVLDVNNEVSYLIHSPENVTELTKATQREQAGIEALRRQQEQLFSTFMQAPVGIGIFKGRDFIVELINPPLCELYSKTFDELIGKPVFEVIPEAKGLGFEELLNKVLETGEAFKGNGMAVPLLKQGNIKNVYVNFVYEPFRELDGHISGVIAIATDVTEQVNSRQRLEETEERARLAVDAVGLGTFDLDLNNGVMITSKAVANIFGFDEPVSREEYVKAYHADDLSIRIRAHEDALKTGRLMYEARIIWPDNSLHWCRIEGKVFYDAEKKGARILGTVLDITEQKRAKEQQERLLEEQKFLEQQKDNFIGIASHELKTPVTSIKAYAQVLEQILTKNGSVKEANMVQRMDKQLDRLTSLIGDLLDVTKMNSGKIQFNETVFEFNELADEVVDDLQRITDRHIIIKDFHTTGKVMADKDRVGQVIMNFVTNAIKYSPNSDKIIVHTSVHENKVLLSVQDFGIGISEKNMDKVFKQFYRVAGEMQHTFPGLGLGLFISSEIIKREGGKIWVTSKLDEGSVFHFELPLYEG